MMAVMIFPQSDNVNNSTLPISRQVIKMFPANMKIPGIFIVIYFENAVYKIAERIVFPNTSMPIQVNAAAEKLK